MSADVAVAAASAAADWNGEEVARALAEASARCTSPGIESGACSVPAGLPSVDDLEVAAAAAAAAEQLQCDALRVCAPSRPEPCAPSSDSSSESAESGSESDDDTSDESTSTGSDAQEGPAAVAGNPVCETDDHERASGGLANGVRGQEGGVHGILHPTLQAMETALDDSARTPKSHIRAESIVAGHQQLHAQVGCVLEDMLTFLENGNMADGFDAQTAKFSELFERQRQAACTAKPTAAQRPCALPGDSNEDKGQQMSVAAGLDLPPPSTLAVPIGQSDRLEPAGIISSIVEGVAVVQAHKAAQPLDVGSLLCTSDRQPIGLVDDIFGPVDGPMYIVRYCGEGILDDHAKEGDFLFCVAKYSTYLDAMHMNHTVMIEEQEADWFIAGESDNDSDDMVAANGTTVENEQTAKRQKTKTTGSLSERRQGERGCGVEVKVGDKRRTAKESGRGGHCGGRGGRRAASVQSPRNTSSVSGHVNAPQATKRGRIPPPVNSNRPTVKPEPCEGPWNNRDLVTMPHSLLRPPQQQQQQFGGPHFIGARPLLQSQGPGGQAFNQQMPGLPSPRAGGQPLFMPRPPLQPRAPNSHGHFATACGPSVQGPYGMGQARACTHGHVDASRMCQCLNRPHRHECAPDNNTQNFGCGPVGWNGVSQGCCQHAPGPLPPMHQMCLISGCCACGDPWHQHTPHASVQGLPSTPGVHPACPQCCGSGPGWGQAQSMGPPDQWHTCGSVNRPQEFHGAPSSPPFPAWQQWGQGPRRPGSGI
eukprot:evm.model.scf_418.9 EVM.evm.TU.scf_418.9   scf_418:51700-56669(+)